MVESYEKEPKERIDECLSCTIPECLCHGIGDCKNRVKRDSSGKLQQEILRLWTEGKKPHQIAEALCISKGAVYSNFARMRKKGMMERSARPLAKRKK